MVEKTSRIKLLLMDCDGVLTDGRLYFSANGEAMKVFHVRDGQGIAAWHKAGMRSGIITGRDAEQIINARATELGIHYVTVKCIDKVAEFKRILSDAGVTADETAYIGDDTPDIEVLKLAGFSAAPADAHPSVKSMVDRVTTATGGHGAVREVIDFLMTSR